MLKKLDPERVNCGYPNIIILSLLVLQDDMLIFQSTSILDIEMRSSPERILCRYVKGKQELEVCIYNTHTTAM